MKKVLRMQDLECANCAAKMEDKIRRLDGVNSVTVSFLMQTMTLDADDAKWDSVVKQAAAICRKIEPDCRLMV